MPWCSTLRRSRSGRKISVPAISTISSASRLISPCATRQAPSAMAAAAPRAVPRSVKPRVSRPSASTQNVLLRQRPRPLRQPSPEGGALAERLQRRQALHGVEEFLAERLEGAAAGEGGAAVGIVHQRSAAPASAAPPPAAPRRSARPTTRARRRSPPARRRRCRVAAGTGRRRSATARRRRSPTASRRRCARRRTRRGRARRCGRTVGPAAAPAPRPAVPWARTARRWSSQARIRMQPAVRGGRHQQVGQCRAAQGQRQHAAEEDEAQDAEAHRGEAQQHRAGNARAQAGSEFPEPEVEIHGPQCRAGAGRESSSGPVPRRRKRLPPERLALLGTATGRRGPSTGRRTCRRACRTSARRRFWSAAFAPRRLR